MKIYIVLAKNNKSYIFYLLNINILHSKSLMKAPPYYHAHNMLLLDDEIDIVAVMLALEKKGFGVVGFAGPLLALEHFQRS